MYKIEILPADHGDCLWIEYGSKKKPHRVLIDGGTEHSFDILHQKIKDHPDDKLFFELFVVTHIDADHIGGSLELMRNFDELSKKVEFGDIWFNGWKHLVSDALGADQGERFTNHLERRKLPWNEAFDKEKIVISDNELPKHKLPGGLEITLLSPTQHKLDRLRDTWETTINDLNKRLGAVPDDSKYFSFPPDALGDDSPDVEELANSKFTSEYSAANGSSIAFLAEYKENTNDKRPKSCLFTGDAQTGVMIKSIKRLIDDFKKNGREDSLDVDGRLIVDAFKISHHGSKKNIRKELLDLVNCSKFLFSTSGQQFKHPDKEAVARVIKFGRNGLSTDNITKDPQLYFNYRSEYNQMWGDLGMPDEHEYEVVYPSNKDEGVTIEL